MKYTICGIILFIIAQCSWAMDITLTNGIVLHNAVIKDVQGERVKIFHASGIGYFNMSEFSQDTRITLFPSQKQDAISAPSINAAPIENEEPYPTNSLEFKGLALGASRKQMARLIQNTFWEYEYDMPSAKTGDAIFLGAKLNATSSFRIIGAEGPDGHKRNYPWENVYVKFYKERIYSIDVSSDSWSAEYIDSRLKDWLNMAYKGLTQKYGEPTERIREISDIDIFSFEAGYNKFTHIWDINGQRVTLAISTYESEFSASIIFTDMNISKQMESESTTDINL